MMKCMIYIISPLMLALNLWAGVVPAETIQRLQKIYPNQTKEFIELRLSNAQSVFEKWRSFPPYFYDLVKRTKISSSISKRQGFCTGDPHVENFGFLPLKKESVHFGINDLDDATDCLLDLDLIRLYLAHKFYGVQFQGESFYKSYQTGLSGTQCSEPKYIKELAKDAIKKGRGVSKKALKMLEEKSCSGEFSFLSIEDQYQIVSILEKASPLSGQKNWKLLHSCSRMKSHGGSAGEKRFVLFMQDLKGDIHHLELKPLVTPAPDVGRQMNLTQRKDIFTKSVSLFYGEELLNEYFTVIFQNKLYQRRPLWAGVQEVSRDDLAELPTEEKQEVLNYEACILGGLHRLSSSTPLGLSAAQIEAFSSTLEHQFRQEMGH
jgi:hypothetical protein